MLQVATVSCHHSCCIQYILSLKCRSTNKLETRSCDRLYVMKVYGLQHGLSDGQKRQVVEGQCGIFCRSDVNVFWCRRVSYFRSSSSIEMPERVHYINEGRDRASASPSFLISLPPSLASSCLPPTVSIDSLYHYAESEERKVDAAFGPDPEEQLLQGGFAVSKDT